MPKGLPHRTSNESTKCKQVADGSGLPLPMSARSNSSPLTHLWEKSCSFVNKMEILRDEWTQQTNFIFIHRKYSLASFSKHQAATHQGRRR